LRLRGPSDTAATDSAAAFKVLGKHPVFAPPFWGVFGVKLLGSGTSSDPAVRVSDDGGAHPSPSRRAKWGQSRPGSPASSLGRPPVGVCYSRERRLGRFSRLVGLVESPRLGHDLAPDAVSRSPRKGRHSFRYADCPPTWNRHPGNQMDRLGVWPNTLDPFAGRDLLPFRKVPTTSRARGLANPLILGTDP
jgi:hypothetical protein